MATTTGDLAPNSLSLSSPLGQSSGGFGFSPQDARDLGASLGLWGYDPTIATPEWSLFPSLSLRTGAHKILTALGVTGPKEFYVTAAGEWATRDTTGGGTNLADGVADSAMAPLFIKSVLNVSDSNRIDFFRQDGVFVGHIQGHDQGLIMVAPDNSGNPVGMLTADKNTGYILAGNGGGENKQGTGGRRVSRERITVTNSDVIKDVWGNRITTTDATQATALQVNLDSNYASSSNYDAPNSTYQVTCFIRGSRTDGTSGGCAYTIVATFRNQADLITQIGTNTIVTSHESDAGLDGTLDVLESYLVRARVTGLASSTWTFHATFEIRGLTD
jgi:hypothetical protein